MMTRDDVLRMALEAGFPLLGPARTEAAMRFADMVTADLKAANAELLEALRQLLHEDSEQYAWEVWEKHGGAA